MGDRLPNGSGSSGPRKAASLTPQAMNTRALWALPLALACASCQAPDPKVECARLATELQGVVDRRTKPPIGADSFFWYLRQGETLANLRMVATPYGERLNTADPITFCESLTGKNPLPTYLGVPNPFRVRF